ncbi:hypothetical protein D3C72_1972890 [compost metagenome]
MGGEGASQQAADNRQEQPGEGLRTQPQVLDDEGRRTQHIEVDRGIGPGVGQADQHEWSIAQLLGERAAQRQRMQRLALVDGQGLGQVAPAAKQQQCAEQGEKGEDAAPAKPGQQPAAT